MTENEEYDYEALPESASVVTHLVAGALAGITEHTVMHPFDSIKTRMQIINPNPQAVYSGVVQAITRMTTTEGARSLWRGVNSVILGAGPAHALYFATYEQCKTLFGGSALGHHPIATGAAGACATIASDALMNPFDVIKQRMQVHGSNYKSVIECAKKVFKAEGFSAFYVSYPTTLMMTIPFQSIQFATYEYFCGVLNPSRTYDPKTHIISGGVAGAFAAAATTPLDVAKTLLQTRGTSTNAEVRNASGMFSAFRIIMKHDGMRGLLRGWKPRVLSHMPATAISWSTYEYFKWFIKSRNQEALVTANP